MDLHKVEVSISIKWVKMKTFLNSIMLSIKGLKMLLSSDDELKWEQSPHGSSFEILGVRLEDFIISKIIIISCFEYRVSWGH